MRRGLTWSKAKAGEAIGECFSEEEGWAKTRSDDAGGNALFDDEAFGHVLGAAHINNARNARTRIGLFRNVICANPDRIEWLSVDLAVLCLGLEVAVIGEAQSIAIAGETCAKAV